MNTLENLKLPTDLKGLSTSELEKVADEVRTKIIDVISKTGGHLSSSLGAIELTVALHSAFDSPTDKIIWDVGHQAYSHKILTGRLNSFNTLRQQSGISGFPNIAESEHDHFTVGHASTSISSALGLARARDLNGQNNSIVAVIGDGALSGGLAWEALNNLSFLKSNLIVILNDNEMSISKNVGSLSNYLTYVRTNPIYNKLKERVDGLIRKIPRFGVALARETLRLKDRTKHFLLDLKFEVIFEELGLRYFGPIDGHNIPLLISTLHFVKDIKEPVILHILTKKGKGYAPAEKDPTLFHGTIPFEIESGNSRKKGSKITFTSAFGNSLCRLAEKNNKIVAITAAMTQGTGLEDFAKKFPDRFFDVGIAEEHAVTFAGGMAKGGFKPIVAIYSTFLQRAYDQIMHDVALQNAGVVFALDRAGIVGEDGATHNGIFDLAYLRTVPNMVVMAPKDENELQHMLYTATNYNGPIAIRYPRGSSNSQKMDAEFKELKIGQGEKVYQTKASEDKVLILALGAMVEPALEAAKLLEADQINSTVLNMRYLKPLDTKLIQENLSKAKLIISVEDGIVNGGFGDAVLDFLNTKESKVKFKALGLPDIFIEHGTRNDKLKEYKLDAQGISLFIKENLS